MEKAYEIKGLMKKLEDQGLPMLEDAAGKVYIAMKEWLKESAELSTDGVIGKIDDFIAPQLDLLDPIVLPQIDKIDGVVG